MNKALEKIYIPPFRIIRNTLMQSIVLLHFPFFLLFYSFFISFDQMYSFFEFCHVTSFTRFTNTSYKTFH